MAKKKGKNDKKKDDVVNVLNRVRIIESAYGIYLFFATQCLSLAANSRKIGVDFASTDHIFGEMEEAAAMLPNAAPLGMGGPSGMPMQYSGRTA